MTAFSPRHKQAEWVASGSAVRQAPHLRLGQPRASGTSSPGRAADRQVARLATDAAHCLVGALGGDVAGQLAVAADNLIGALRGQVPGGRVDEGGEGVEGEGWQEREGKKALCCQTQEVHCSDNALHL